MAGSCLLLALVAACGASPRRASVAPPVAKGQVPSTTTRAPAPPARPVATTTDPLVAPPYPITEVTLHLVDASRPTVSHGRTISRVRSLVTRVWLPTVARRWPLVVFAHGFEVGPGPYETMLEAWAAHGYVVAASEFPLTDAALAGTNLDESDIDNQPADLRFVADSLVAGTSPVAARIDAARVAVAGHSDGGEVALAASLAPTPAGQPVYRAVIAMSVQPVGTAPTRNPPILVLQGDADTINPPTRGYQTWDRAASPKYLLILHGAEHLPPLQAGSAWLPGIEAETEAFLDAYVAGDGSASQVRSAVAGAPLMSLQSG